MKLFLLLVVLGSSFMLQATCMEVREFAKSTVVIKNDDVTVITKDDTASFFAIGDWGGIPVFPYRTVIEQLTSKLMDQLAQTYNSLFQLAIGDNFYFTGVTDANDKRFKETYEDVFNTEYLKDTPWFVVLGNHDHYGNASAQLDYAKKSKRWILPSYNYTVDVEIENGKQSLISILMIDTVIMCGNSPYEGGAGQPKYQSREDERIGSDYFYDFEQRLASVAATNVPYILVSGHFPVWSIAEHGPTKCLVDRLRPLLHKYGVSAFLCGHDHNLQHIQDTYLGHTVDYIVSGAANFIDENTANINSIPAGSLRFHWADKSKVVNGGFALVQASRSNMTLTFYETTGKELYQTNILPRF